MILQAFIRGAIIIAIAALLSILLRNRSAALRHHIWATALVVQLALLAFIPVLPAINLPVIPTIAAQFDAPLEPTTNRETTNRETDAAAVSPSPPVSVSPGPARSALNINWVVAIWLTGAAWIALRYLIGTFLMMRIAYKGDRIEDGDWLSLAQRTARELGITRPITMIWGDKVNIPITWGVLYPMILLPESAREWPAERRRFVLVHEMAHVKRFDAFTQLLAQITSAIFWFSPFVWIAEWRMRIEREHACDDTVIQHGTEPTLYADELLQMVRSLVRRRAQQPAFAALAMARKSEFEGRMLAILDPDRPRRVTGITSGLMFALLSVLIAAPLAAIDPFAVRVVTQPKAAVLAPAVKSASIGHSQDCKFDTKGEIVHVGDEPAKVDITLLRADRCVFADITGPVGISADEQRIYSVQPGGFVRLREVTPERDAELLIERNTKADLKHSFTINGYSQVDNGRLEREWVARVLPELLTEGAIDPEQRVSRMLKSNGLNTTLQQIGALHSSYARLAHFKALLRVNDWGAAEQNRIAAAAGQSLKGSDLAAFRSALARKELAKPDAKRVASEVELMEQVLTGLTSDYDLRLAMKAQLANADRATLLMFTRAAQKMTSDFDLRLFLVEGVPFYFRKDAPLQEAWFAAARKVASSYERSLVLSSVIELATNNDAITRGLIDATAGMSSGTDKANFLADIAKRKLVTTPELRTAILAQVNTLTTSTDRRTVLEALQ